jgi:excisionase family DNA binding protein
MPQPEEMVSTAKAAQMLGKTRMQVRYLIRTGVLRAERQGTRWMIHRHSIEALKEREEDGAD